VIIVIVGFFHAVVSCLVLGLSPGRHSLLRPIGRLALWGFGRGWVPFVCVVVGGIWHHAPNVPSGYCAVRRNVARSALGWVGARVARSGCWPLPTMRPRPQRHPMRVGDVFAGIWREPPPWGHPAAAEAGWVFVEGLPSPILYQLGYVCRDSYTLTIPLCVFPRKGGEICIPHTISLALPIVMRHGKCYH